MASGCGRSRRTVCRLSGIRRVADRGCRIRIRCANMEFGGRYRNDGGIEPPDTPRRWALYRSFRNNGDELPGHARTVFRRKDAGSGPKCRLQQTGTRPR